MHSILVVDDQSFDITIISSYLENYKLYVAMSGQSAIDLVNEHPIDLILMDMLMPGMSGCETSYQLKNNKETQDIPIIFVTAQTDEDSIVRAFDSSGIDFISKPIKERELLARVNTHLKLSDSIKKLEFLSYKDSMTNILNRRRFFELAQEKFEKDGTDLVAVMIDIDKFKSINDAYGHATGDLVIKYITNTIVDVLPDDAIFGRIGGEEFAIICNRPSALMVSSRMENIRKLIDKGEVIIESGLSIKFTISIGVSHCDGSMKNIDALLSAADKALYDAKGTGRNKVILREEKA